MAPYWDEQYGRTLGSYLPGALVHCFAALKISQTRRFVEDFSGKIPDLSFSVLSGVMYD